MPLIKLQSEGLNLADNFAFTGTITGAGGGKLLQLVQSTFTTKFQQTINGSSPQTLNTAAAGGSGVPSV